MASGPAIKLRQIISPVGGIFVLALLVRVIYNLTVSRGYFPLHDSLTYQNLAFNMLDHHCFCLKQGVTVSRAPLWPFIIAGISLAVGRANILDRLFLCLLDAGTCLLIYATVRDLFGRRLGLIAGFFAAVYPALYIYTGWLYTETIQAFLQAAIVYTLLCVQRKKGRGWRLWGLCGILLGLLALTHPNGIALVALVTVWVVVLVWRRLLPASSLKGAILAIGLASALVAPWTIRNAVVSDAFVPVATGNGVVLRGAYNNIIVTNQAVLGGWRSPGNTEPLIGPPITINPCSARCEVLVNNEETITAVHWAVSHMSKLPLLWFYHLRYFVTPYTHEADMPMDRFAKASARLVRQMSNLFPVPVLLLAVLGLVVTLRRYWQSLLFVYFVIGATVAQILVFYGNARFRTPIEPLLVELAAGAVWWLTDPGPGTLRCRLRQRPGDGSWVSGSADEKGA
jgi:4-amino-4-deoxy-L-arabinose transferase-like glycosyltransferase